METIFIILAVLPLVALIVIVRRKETKAEKEADEAFAAKYGKFVGQEVWRTSFAGNELFDERKNLIEDLKGFDCDQRCLDESPEFFPCKIVKIERCFDSNYKGKIKVVPVAFEADFEIKYISKTAAFLYSEKYGELEIEDDDLYEALKKRTSPTVRLKCDPWILSDKERKQYWNRIDFIIFWEIV